MGKLFFKVAVLPFIQNVLIMCIIFILKEHKYGCEYEPVPVINSVWNSRGAETHC